MALFDLLVYEVPEDVCIMCGKHCRAKLTGYLTPSGKPESVSVLLFGKCSTCYKEWLENARKNQQERSKWG